MATLGALEATLGRRPRFQLSSDPIAKTVIVLVRWPCGCIATGRSYNELMTAWCAQHDAPARDMPTPSRGVVDCLDWTGRPGSSAQQPSQ